MAKVCILFLLWAGLCLPLFAQKKTIAVIGSSTAAGFHLPIDDQGQIMEDQDDNLDNGLPPNSWVNRLRVYYDGLHLLNELDNFAIWGQNIYQAMPDDYHYVGGDTRDDVDGRNNISKALSVNPDIILVNFPSNNYDFYPIDETMARIHDIYDAAIANGHTVCYICTTQPRTSEGFAILDNRTNLKTIRDRIVADFPNHYIDFYTPLVDDQVETSPGVPNDNYLGIKAEFSLGDGTHVNEAGHGVLYNAVLAKNLVPIANLPLAVGKIGVKRIDDTHITVTFTVYEGNTEKEFFIWVKDKAGNTKSVRVVIPDKTKTTQTITETIQIY
ncbi:SGNH/GDSL hydrolase family protein [Puia sp.]|jgi:hypothetical protein|uniref:SGNH/GDSL hydrolase family protein n=1 Tax=Puia sp. TaxID=2045100 RepID=UPI002F3E8473